MQLVGMQSYFVKHTQNTTYLCSNPGLKLGMVNRNSRVDMVLDPLFLLDRWVVGRQEAAAAAGAAR